METISVKKVSVEKICFNVKRFFLRLNSSFLVVFTPKSVFFTKYCPFLGCIFALNRVHEII